MALSILPVTKICSKCTTELSLSDFYKDSRQILGRKSECKVCAKKQTTEYQKRNPEIYRIASQKFRNANPDKHRASVRAYGRKAYAANPEKYIAKSSKYNKENPDKYKKRQHEYYLKHAETRKESVRTWQTENIEKTRYFKRKNAHKRRFALANTRCDLTIEQWNQIKEFYKNRCAFCGEKTKLTQDHFIPVSKGGDHTASNIIPLCRPCNSSKGNRNISKMFQPHLFMVLEAK